MSFYSVDGFIREFYPQYWGYQNYPASQVACIRKVNEEWGILGNFAPTPIELEEITFKSVEQLFQCMKFRDMVPLLEVFLSPHPKFPAKKWEKTHRRDDWGQIFLDCLRFCLQLKFDQSESFRTTLMETGELFIVEDQTNFRKKHPDAYGVKLQDGAYSGPNLMGRFLMELRANGSLSYTLPSDAFIFLTRLRSLSDQGVVGDEG